MTRRPAVLLFVFVSCCVYLSMSIEVKRSRLNSIAGKITCTSREDEDIMKECLEKYKLGFDNLGPYIPGQDPPSCAVDLGLAQCLNQSGCFGKLYTNALRRLIFNQLEFTERVKLCKQNDFQGLLNEAKAKNEKSDPNFGGHLKKITDMRDLTPDLCATFVYGECGRNFTIELRKHPGFNPAALCEVFRQESDCIDNAAKKYYCTDSEILKRFKENSNAAAQVVLDAICSPPSTSHDMSEEFTNEKRQNKLFKLNRNAP